MNPETVETVDFNQVFFAVSYTIQAHFRLAFDEHSDVRKCCTRAVAMFCFTVESFGP